MKALVYQDGLTFQTAYPKPQIQAGQALIKILYAGICNTDLELVRGYMGFSGVLGHEFIGEVVEGSPELMGKRVVGEINVADGTCAMCRRGIRSQCRNRTTVGIDGHQGAFAEYLALTEKNLHIVPESIADKEAVFVEPLAAANHVLDATDFRAGKRAVLIGAGKLGMLTAQVLALTEVDLTVVVRHPKQIDLLGNWGITGVYRDQIPDKEAQIIVDCTGNAKGFATALELVEPCGVIVLKSTYADVPQVNLTQAVVDEVSIIGNRCGSFPDALQLLEKRKIDTMSLIDGSYSFDDAVEAFEYAFQRGILKILLEF